MKKFIISRLWLYRYRFVLGYLVLGCAFLALTICLPLVTPNGLSTSEMESVVKSYDLHISSPASGDLTDLPYRLLQKISIMLFGLTPYAIKLPSIIIGLLLGLLIILLLNRWFKNNVALLASLLAVLSVPFLYLAGSGTPLIMLVFWPILLLWLGSKIQGKTKPRPLYCFVFAFMLLLAIFTPYLIYLVLFILIFVIVNPHLRFTIKKLPKIPLIISCLIIVGGFSLLVYNVISHPSTAIELLAGDSTSFSQFFSNLNVAFLPFFAWEANVESVFLAPMFSIATVALTLFGLFSTTKGFFASRNSIASYFIVFTILLSGLNPNCAILLILPFAILTAHGLRYILEKWYGLFPANPYARIFAIFPIAIFIGIMLITDLSHYIFGYRYNPPVANQFSNDLHLLREHVDQSTILLIPAQTTEYRFYKILEDKTALTVSDTLPTHPDAPIATLGKWPSKIPGHLNRIITSSKADNSDRIYIYK